MPPHGLRLLRASMEAPLTRTSRLALITGAGSGLGRAVALRLAQDGCTVLVTDVETARAESVARELRAMGATATAHTLDVRDWEGWRALAASVGPIDILVNNAGVADVGHLVDTDRTQWDRQIDINLMGVIRGCRTFVPGMVHRGTGHVLNIASLAGLALAPGMISYNTAKAAVVAFSESLRLEVALDGVGVSVCCPAFFRTNLTESMHSASPAVVDRVHKWMDTSGVTADDVARACADAIDQDRFLVLTHRGTWRYWLLKRLWPEHYRNKLLARERQRRARRAIRG